MKTTQHRTSNIEHREPNEEPFAVCAFHEDGANKRQCNLEERQLEFAHAVIDLSEKLPNTQAGTHVSGQILTARTSRYPNHGEAEAADNPSSEAG